MKDIYRIWYVDVSDQITRMFRFDSISDALETFDSLRADLGCSCATLEVSTGSGDFAIDSFHRDL